ncbi:hypothetical protein K438DRAFT_1985881 [Mycena galopus ATCC 62051]|nr:hypothetical protein K438DRAFT_1985881 [Mycena galopus ATCC 62051]
MSRISGDSRVWARVLALVASAAPNLTRLALMGIYQSVEPEVLRFLARLPQLIDIELDQIPTLRPDPLVLLQNLVNLRASPTVVDHLIFHSAVCPSIRSIELVWNSDDTGRVFPNPDSLYY